MKTVKKLAKLLQVSLVLLLLLFFATTNVAYARGGCFGSGTSILTPEGHKPIEQLHQGDRILGYNLTTHQIEAETIGEIQVISSPDYYLINNTTKVTGTHPFYIQMSAGLNLVETQNLKVGDRFLGENNAQSIVSSIDHIEEPITVYNLLSITPDHNFYADGILVHNKGGGGGGGHGGGGGYGARTYGSNGYSDINAKTAPGLILAFIVTVCALLPCVFLREIYNFIRFFGKDFTDDSSLIEFTKTINSKFSNCYSIEYSKDNERWKIISTQAECDEQNYQEVINKAELFEKVSHLFMQYQHDWTNKNFTDMIEYVDESFYTRQHNIFLKDFGNNFDVVYKPELLEIVPINYQQSQENHIFQIQINARMINFELSPEGHVLSGEPHPRSFTEYWTIRVDDAKTCYLMDIDQASVTL